jgi:hypothetical protein
MAVPSRHASTHYAVQAHVTVAPAVAGTPTPNDSADSAPVNEKK